jgi:2-polyprenyl-3-methyl-5-hydroxy-6-metoxy-1,4-benzoquinol methylase
MIHDTGYWTIQGKRYIKEHAYDPKLSDALVKLALKLNILKSYDFGCGPGKYVENFRKHGIETDGYDGNPITSSIPNCYIKDLTTDFQLTPVDFLLCLEVCEHVPKKFEDNLLRTIDRHVNPGGTLVISWAIIGQGGFGHVNCQNNDYVISKFLSMNYSFDKNTSDYLREQESCAKWFRNTILVFNKNV